jgi:hypothetical protein
MMRVFQELRPDSVATDFYTSHLSGQYAAYEGIVHDLEWVANCLVRISDALAVPPIDHALVSAFTWQTVLLYARCFEATSQGRRAPLGGRALRVLTADERRLHEGLLAVRHTRFAHAGSEANHRTLCSLMPDKSLQLGFQIEEPSGMVDAAQVALAMDLVAKMLEFAAAKRDKLREMVTAELLTPEVSGQLALALKANPGQVQPEAIALRLMRQIGLE